MALEPEGVTKKGGASGLEGFGRKRMELAGLTVIAPSDMVVIDDSLQQAPNMYDGLPRKTKVLYLLTTLNSHQWDAITGNGLGMSDLSTDQKAVFTSLLPRPFIYSRLVVNTNGNLDPVDKDLQLSDADQQGVRLHVDRSIDFMMPIIGQPRSMTGRNTRTDYGEPGAKVAERDWMQDIKTERTFGTQIRQTVPNRQKPSDLDFRAAAFNRSIQLNPSERIADLLSRIGAATNLELRADLRVGDRKITAYGTTAPIASVLKAIALSVTGTYRKVGGLVILTSDQTGLGTRKMKLAAYDEDLNTKVYREENEWRRQIYGSGHLSQIGFPSNDRLKPTDSLIKKMDHAAPGNDPKLTAADLNQSLSDFIERQNKIYRTQQVTIEGASAESDFSYSFILPSGEETRTEFQGLGSYTSFAYTNTGSRQTELPAASKVDVSKISMPVCLAASVDAVGRAKLAVDLASRFGFKELWVDTLSPEALKAAVSAAAPLGIKISLIVRPFDYRGPADNAAADRTIFGDGPDESLKRRMADKDWEMVQQKVMSGMDRLGCISPLSADFRGRLQAIPTLAATPGLAGIHVLNSTPQGYNGLRVEYISFPGPLFLEMGNFGYAEDLRAAFIRDHNIDPIDLCPSNVHTNSDLRQPFFLDDGLRGGNSVYDGSDQPNPALQGMMAVFDTWLAKLNRQNLQAVLDAVTKAQPDLPISMTPISTAMNAVNRPEGGLVDWRRGEPLPEIADGGQNAGKKPVVMVSANDANLPMVRFGLNYLANNKGKESLVAGLIIDLLRLTPKEADDWLSGVCLAGRPSK